MYIDIVKVVATGGHPHLVPRYDSDVEKANALSQNTIYRVTLRRPRNAKHHRKLMAMIQFVFKNTERWHSTEQILISLKYELGLVDFVQGFDGATREVPRSIAFDEMDQDEFANSVYEPAVDLLAKEVGLARWEFEELFTKYKE